MGFNSGFKGLNQMSDKYTWFSEFLLFM